MRNISQILSIFSDDVKHLHGNLFRVKRNRIKLSSPGLKNENGKLVYGNPRWFINKDGKPEAKGINEKSKMEELKNSIQDEGLENPIRLRVIEGKKNFLEVINGERRFRSIEELCEKNVLCFDPITNDQKNAEEVFEWIDARIDFMDDKMALRIALKPNETSEIIGDMANLSVVRVLRQSGYDDQEILSATGKSISWLRETDRIIALDEVCYEHFCSEKINRTVALHLSQIEDANERLELLEKITKTAVLRHAEKNKLTVKKKEKAEKKAEIELAEAELAEKYGDKEEAEIHKEKSKKAKVKAEKLQEKIEEESASTPTATSKDLEKEISAKPLSHNKIRSIYIDTIDAIVNNDGYDDDGDSYGLDLDVLQKISAILEAILAGEKDVMQILTDNCLIESDAEDVEDVEAVGDDDEEEDDRRDEEYEDDEYENDDDDADYEESDEYEEETPIELEKEFEEAAMNDEEDFD